MRELGALRQRYSIVLWLVAGLFGIAALRFWLESAGYQAVVVNVVGPIGEEVSEEKVQELAERLQT